MFESMSAGGSERSSERSSETLAERTGIAADPGRPAPRRVRRHGPTHGLVGESPSVEAIRRALRAVAPTRSTVLVTGETGTGKGLVARLLHELSGEDTFVHVDCASLAPSVIESELFGHERGAFTGAAERHVGRCERAGSGTLFLDEIADVEPALQAKLLRVLQDRVFERVGGRTTLPLRARVVAATNRDLAAEIAAGRFRADLYYRLQVVELRVPALRHRKGDLPLLFRAAVERIYACRAAPAPRASAGLHARLAAWDWPGNVRELLNLAERLSVSKPDGPWCEADLDELGFAPGPGRSGATAAALAPEPVALSRARFEACERAELERALVGHRFNVTAAARSLGLSRGALRGRMARLGLR
jgi:DNA-binding NtrC family response regulator